jgi:DNA primase catalytic core
MAKKDVLKGRSIVSKNIFDTANQSIEEIKRANPIIDYFKSHGVDLKSTGTNQFMGLCPFHNDTNPSLSVNDEKNVFKCFGCGKSGTVIDAVSLFENIGTGEAIKKLQGKKKTKTDDLFPPLNSKEKADENQNQNDLKLDLSDIEPPELPPEEKKTEDEPSDFNLNKITEYYHKKLYENQKATEYLTKRGLKNPEIIKRFKIGFADGSLLNIIGENQKQDLIKAGIVHEKGFEVFRNCLIFPIFDDNDNTVGLYARNIDDKAKVKHLYLKGKHKGIFNRKASKVYDEIILTESIIDALSLIEICFDNVQSVYGINGFTDEHLQTLKDDRVKTVSIAFDKDEAGIKASDELKDKLINENFKVKIITPPVKKDWNESLQDGIVKDEIQSLLDSAVIFEKKENKKAFEVKKDGFGYIFSIGEINYSVSNVKDSFTHNLKVNIRTEYQGERFPDNVDLYSSRSRDALSLKLSQRFGVEVKRVEKDLLLILDYLEDEQRKRLEVGDDKEEQPLTDEEKQIGTEFLKSPDLFNQIVKDMEVLGYVGEDLNKILLYIASSTRVLDDPISIMIISQSSAGKSFLIETVRKLIPSSDVVAITSLSDMALNYTPNLMHKFLIMGEAVHNEVVEHQIRDMLSNKELSRLVTVKDEKTGKMTSEFMVTKAIVSMVLGGTSYDVNPENASRFFVVNVDETIDQTNRIHALSKNKQSLETSYLKEDVIPLIINKHHFAQKLLQPILVVNPFRDLMNFPNTTMRSRRDFVRFIDLLGGVCFLRQYQKEKKTDGRFTYIECDLMDYEITYNITVESVLPATMSDLPSAAVSLYEDIRQMTSIIAKKNNIRSTDVEFIQREIREFTRLNMDTVKKQLRILVAHEYIQLIGGKTRGTRYSYKLREDKSIDKIDLSMIPTPSQMAIMIKERGIVL